MTHLQVLQELKVIAPDGAAFLVVAYMVQRKLVRLAHGISRVRPRVDLSVPAMQD